MKMVSYREEGGEDRNVCMILFWVYHFYIVLTCKPISWKIKLNSKNFFNWKWTETNDSKRKLQWNLKLYSVA